MAQPWERKALRKWLVLMVSESFTIQPGFQPIKHVFFVDHDMCFYMLLLKNVGLGP
jgi:hypothetical protein